MVSVYRLANKHVVASWFHEDEQTFLAQRDLPLTMKVNALEASPVVIWQLL